MGQLFTTLNLEMEKLAEADGRDNPLRRGFKEAWVNTGGREILLDMTLKGEADSMKTYIYRLARKKCFGCIHECPGQRDHNYCIMDPTEVIPLLFDEALDRGAIDALYVMMVVWMR